MKPVPPARRASGAVVGVRDRPNGPHASLEEVSGATQRTVAARLGKVANRNIPSCPTEAVAQHACLRHPGPASARWPAGLGGQSGADGAPEGGGGILRGAAGAVSG